MGTVISPCSIDKLSGWNRTMLETSYSMTILLKWQVLLHAPFTYLSKFSFDRARILRGQAAHVLFCWFNACTASGNQCKYNKEFTIWFSTCTASGKSLGAKASSPMSALQCYHVANLVARHGACRQLAFQCEQHSLR